jgi:hypothetical protein
MKTETLAECGVCHTKFPTHLGACPECHSSYIAKRSLDRQVDENLGRSFPFGALGGFLFLLGLAGIAFFFFLWSSAIGDSTVANMDKLNFRLCGVVASSAFVVAGSVFLARK